MENSFQTSFIPKKPIVSSGTIVSSSSSNISIFMVLAVIILFVAGASAGGLFFYKNYLTTQIGDLSSSIVKAQNNFDKDTIKELELFDKRTSTASTVLKNHIVLSPIFKMIADITISQVQYTKFEHQNSDNGFNVKMSGIAADYKSIALQSDVFNSSKGRSFKNVVFSNITKDKNNYINFDVSFDIDPSLLSFESNLSNINKSLDQNKTITPVTLPQDGSSLPDSNVTQ